MKFLSMLLNPEATEATVEATEKVLRDTPATAKEALQLMAEGWGSIFIVIIIMIFVIMVLNKVFSKAK